MATEAILSAGNPAARPPIHRVLRSPSALILADARDWAGSDARRLRRMLLGSRLPVLLVGEPTPGAPRADGWVAPESIPASLRLALGLDPDEPGPTAVERRLQALLEQHERLLREMRMAEQVQRSMLPRTLPAVPGVRFGAAVRPCQHMAGDFYHAFRLDRDRVGFYVGDVMGHGPASALLSVFAMQVLRTKRIEGHSYEILSPSEALAGLNRDLIAGDFPGEPFVTMFYAVLDVPRRHLRYCSAGHPPALLLRGGQPPCDLAGGGPLLGVLEAEFQCFEVELRPGDRLVLYSDGVEATRWSDALPPGLTGLAEHLAGSDDLDPQGRVDALMASARLDDWRPDDLTLLMAEIEG
jgi:sigma-B regulation protein RsbU (phosphoserine phosphatase)